MIATKIAHIAPKVFAKTSVTSEALVVVYTPCMISIVIPNKTENINETKKAFASSAPFNSFLKNKIHEIVNPK